MVKDMVTTVGKIEWDMRNQGLGEHSQGDYVKGKTESVRGRLVLYP